jgi:hypothetical protein
MAIAAMKWKDKRQFQKPDLAEGRNIEKKTLKNLGVGLGAGFVIRLQ